MIRLGLPRAIEVSKENPAYESRYPDQISKSRYPKYDAAMVYTFIVEITASCIARAAFDKKNQHERRYQSNDNCHQKTGLQAAPETPCDTKNIL